MNFLNTKHIAKIFGFKKYKVNKISYQKDYPSTEPQRRCPNINKAKDMLDFHPKISLKKGLRNHFLWAKKVFKN